MAWTLEGLLEELSAKLQNHPRWTTADRKRELNRAVNWLILFASEDFDVREATPVVDPDDTSQYLMEMPLPDELMVLESVSFNGYPLRELSHQEFITTRAEFSTRTGPPFAGYYIRKNLYLNIWPRPGTSKTIQVYGVFKATEMVDDDDVPGIEEIYGESLVSRAAYRLKLGIPGEENAANAHLVDALRERADAHFNMTQNYTHKIGRK